jgi:sugar phosphate permease
MIQHRCPMPETDDMKHENTDSQGPDTGSDNSASSASARGESGIIWILWATYGAFYFCRTNIAAAVPGLMASVDRGGLGLSGEEVGWILAALKITYGLGQFVNGQFSEHISPRILLAIGMFSSVALNVLFGLGTGFYFLLFVWACNGYFQSMGWTPCMRVAANWIPVQRRGHAIGIIGTGYQITLGLTYLVSSQAAVFLGWQGALYVPSIFLAATGVFTLLTIRTAPEKVPDEEASLAGRQTAGTASLADNIYSTFYNPVLWLLGLALGLLNACRYGFLDWGMTHLMEVQNTSVGAAGLKFFVIAIGAVAGSYLAGWVSDRFFGARRAPIIVLLLILLGVLTLLYESVARSSVTGTILLLVLIGFCIYGPQVLLVGSAPVDLAHRGTSAAAAGFVNFMGYMGAATGDVVTGHYSDPANGGWQVAIFIWSAWAFTAAAVTALLWNFTAHKIRLLPSRVPRIAGLASLAVAAMVALVTAFPPIMIILIVTALISFACSSSRRNLALITIAAMIAVMILSFTDIMLAGSESAWSHIFARVLFGLSIVTGIMVVVERRSKLCALS